MRWHVHSWNRSWDGLEYERVQDGLYLEVKRVCSRCGETQRRPLMKIFDRSGSGGLSLRSAGIVIHLEKLNYERSKQMIIEESWL